MIKSGAVELTFNLIWLAIALCAAGYWLRCASPQKRAVGTALGLLVVGCALLLLFPSVSLSDDLCAASLALEDANASARKAHPVPLQHHFLVASPAPALAPSFTAIEWMPESKRAIVQSPAVALRAGRAPPLA